MKKKYSSTTDLDQVSEPAAVYSKPDSFSSHIFKDNYSLIKKANEGVKTEVFYTLAEKINMPEKILASIINLSPRTISNYRDQEKDLDPNYSEHLLKIVKLYKLGIDIFGNVKEFSAWMERPFYNSDEKPLDFLNTSGGVDLIAEEIEKLAQGYPL